MIRFVRVQTALVVCSFLLFFTALPEEHIKNYHSDITIHQGGTLDVTETIIVWAEGKRILNGITREFPTVYQSGLLRTIIPFELKSVTRNGYHLPTDDLEPIKGGKRVYLRGGGRLKVPGTYTFRLRYTTGRQIGFFDEHDELYFNVVGADSVFPIDYVSATVHLPKNVTADQIKGVGYAGSLWSKQEAYTLEIIDKHTIRFICTKSLASYQAFSIVIAMPKGSITAPTERQRWVWFLTDNVDLLLAVFFLVLLLGYLLVSYILIKKNQPQSRVIPLFEPPTGFTPGMVNYFAQRGFKPEALSADIVNMGVNGWITIEVEKGKYFWHPETYKLTRTEKPCENSYYRGIIETLFEHKKVVKLHKSERESIEDSTEFLKDQYKKLVDTPFFNNHQKVFYGALIFAGISTILLYHVPSFIGVMSPDASMFFTFACVPIFFLFHFLLRSYTHKGFEIKDHIEGFKLYLSTAESKRLSYVSTPPVKTPELYEKFLPYAIALGVEEKWTQQFVPVFDKLMVKGSPYVATWYHGRGGLSSHTLSRGFTTSIGSSLASTIGASAPGSSSGFGGGRSGGGGGAGGGGGGGGVGGC